MPSFYFSETAKRSLSGSAATIIYVSGKAISANLYIFSFNSGFGAAKPPKLASILIESSKKCT